MDDRDDEPELGPSEGEESIIDGMPLRSEVTAVDYRLALELIIERATRLGKVLSYLPPNSPVSHRDVKMLHFLIADLGTAEEGVEDFLAANRDLDIRHTIVTQALGENEELRRQRLQDTGHSQQQRAACANGKPKKAQDATRGRVAAVLPPADPVPHRDVHIPVPPERPLPPGPALPVQPAVPVPEDIATRLFRYRYPDGVKCRACASPVEGAGAVRWCQKRNEIMTVQDGTLMANVWYKAITLPCWEELFKLVAASRVKIRHGAIGSLMERYGLQRAKVNATINIIKRTPHEKWLCDAFGVPHPLVPDVLPADSPTNQVGYTTDPDEDEITYESELAGGTPDQSGDGHHPADQPLPEAEVVRVAMP